MKETRNTAHACAHIDVAVRVAVTCSVTGATVNGWATQLCDNGMAIDAECPFAIGAQVELNALAREGNQLVRLKLPAKVIIKPEGATGFRFTELTDADHALVARLLAYFPHAA